MAGITVKSFSSPDETRSPDKTQLDVEATRFRLAAQLETARPWIHRPPVSAPH